MIIEINVANKIATPVEAPVIVCGNSDYEAVFTFDSEWDEYETKTARFSFIRNYKECYIDILFYGNSCPMPVLSNITEVKIGVYAGDLHTTTPARIECKKSILCGDPVHVDPPEDVYNQITEMLAENYPLEAAFKAAEAAKKADEAAQKALEVREEIEEGGFIDSLKEQNEGEKFSVWVGTQAEYDSLPYRKDNCLYIIEDDTRPEPNRILFFNTDQRTFWIDGDNTIPCSEMPDLKYYSLIAINFRYSVFNGSTTDEKFGTALLHRISYPAASNYTVSFMGNFPRLVYNAETSENDITRIMAFDLNCPTNFDDDFLLKVTCLGKYEYQTGENEFTIEAIIGLL